MKSIFNVAVVSAVVCLSAQSYAAPVAKTFVGTYASNSSGPKFAAVASLKELNPEGSEIPALPKLRLDVLICSGTSPFQQYQFDLVAVDPIRNLARFRRSSTQSAANTLDLAYNSGWQQLSGEVKANERSPLAVVNSQLQLTGKNLPKLNCENVQID